jgi:cyanophycin synthetase
LSEDSEARDWQLLGKVQALTGYAYGSRYPGLIVTFEGLALAPAEQQRLWAFFKQRYPGLDHPESTAKAPQSEAQAWHNTVEWLLTLWQKMQLCQGLPIHEKGEAVALNGHRARCLIPTLDGAQRAMAVVVQRTFDGLNLSVESTDSSLKEQKWSHALDALAEFSPKGSNVPRFIKAAHELGIPFRALPGGVYQYGLGRQAHRLDSSFTDNTSTISAKLARSKVWASALLRQCGVPVPNHQLVNDAESAVRAALRLGYPVVVKPADLDGGVGVASELQTSEEVREAFDAAFKHSKNILVEKHVPGRDYRLTVFNGELIWAIERVPAGVIGDGQNTVMQLIDQTNADPRRGVGQHAPLKRLIVDAESRGLLLLQEMSLTSVPPKGCFVRLRRAANVASGGTPVAVFDHVHPDNAQLSVRAAEALGLDLAGIDLLIPDIAVSWRTSGAAICEVNGQPNLGQTTAAHLYAQILKKIVPGSGRVPTFFVFGAEHPQDWLNALQNLLEKNGLTVGVVNNDEVRVAGELMNFDAQTSFAGGRMLALNRRVDAMVIAIGDDSILRTGLPVERYDVAVLAGTNIHCSHKGAETDRIRSLLKCLLPACEGEVIVRADQEVFLKAQQFSRAASWHVVNGGDTELLLCTLSAAAHSLT